MSACGLAVCALVLVGGVREDIAWYAWATVPLLLLVHDLTHALLRAPVRKGKREGVGVGVGVGADPGAATAAATANTSPLHALLALLLATIAASASAIVQSTWSASTSNVAPVIAWLVPVLLMGAPPARVAAWLGRHAMFATATALAALAATQHAHVGVVPQFLCACLLAGAAEVGFAAVRAKATRAPNPSEPDS